MIHILIFNIFLSNLFIILSNKRSDWSFTYRITKYSFIFIYTETVLELNKPKIQSQPVFICPPRVPGSHPPMQLCGIIVAIGRFCREPFESMETFSNEE